MNDIDKMPSKCRDCPYWELATYPWCCGDCKDIMNPKNGEYIKRIDAKRALTALSADLDAETVQRCIEAMNNLKAADVEPKQKWIPVTDVENLPKKSTPCLVSCNQWGGEIVRKAIYLASENCFTERGIDITEYVTHWMESPKPPEGVYNA